MANIDNDDGDETLSAGKRAKLIRRFKSEEGDLLPRATGESVSLVFEYVHNRHRSEFTISELSDKVLRAAAEFGLNTSLGNVFNTYDGDPDAAIDAVETRWEVLKSGQWSTDRRVGPRLDDVLDAWAEHRHKNGAPIDMAWRDRAKGMIISGEKPIKDLLETPAIKAEYEGIRSRRHAERAAKLAEQAAGQVAPSDLLD